MIKSAKTVSGKPAAPARKQTKQAQKPAVAMPAVAEVIRKSAKRSPVAQLTQAVAKKRARKAAVPVLAPAPARSNSEVSAEQRRCYVEVAAYFIAERHGFTPGRENEDWIEAEAEIDRMLA